MASLDQIEIITFDCYGTLIDWETGIRETLGELAKRHGVDIPTAELVREWETIQFEMIQGPFRRYHGVLRDSLKQLFKRRGVSLNAVDAELLAQRISKWRPFDDTRSGLARLRKRYLLAILSNIDDEVLNDSVTQLGVEFDELITSEQLLSYKPRPAHFEEVLRCFDRPAEVILHCAFSLKYDHTPAQSLGISTVLVKRPGSAAVDDVQPTYQVDSLNGLAELLGLP